MKIRPVEAALFHVDGETDGRSAGQTDVTKLIVTFHNFANEPERLCYNVWLGKLTDQYKTY